MAPDSPVVKSRESGGAASNTELDELPVPPLKDLSSTFTSSTSSSSSFSSSSTNTNNVEYQKRKLQNVTNTDVNVNAMPPNPPKDEFISTNKKPDDSDMSKNDKS